MAAAASSAIALTAWATSGAGAQEADGAFVNGTAKAAAVVGRVAPGVGSLQLALGAGIAVSEIRNSLFQAQAQALDLGLIGTVLTAEGCDGSDAPVTPEQLPQPLRIDNRNGPASASEDELPAAGATFGGGRKEVSATDDGSSATMTGFPIDISPVIKIDGGRAHAATRIVDGNAREALATSTMSMDIAGVLRLEGMVWRAFHRTGAGPKVEGTFEIGSAAGQTSPLGIGQIADPTEPVINELLAPSGISVTFPEVVHQTEPTDVIRVTPMRIVLKDSPAGATALGPVLDATREQRVQLFEQVASQYCQAAGALLVGDIAVTIASGNGFLALEIGGAEATTAEVATGNPFGSFSGSEAASGPVALPASGASLPSSGGGVPVAPSTAGPATGGVDTSNVRPAVEIGPIERVCESVNPIDWPPCSHGAALPLGLAGLGVTAGAASLDVLAQRRRAAMPA